MPLDRPRTVAPVPLRFEDVTQDGRLVLEALPSALGPTVWHGVRDHDKAARACMKHGVVPILTRFVLEGTAGPLPPHPPAAAQGTAPPPPAPPPRPPRPPPCTPAAAAPS